MISIVESDEEGARRGWATREVGPRAAQNVDDIDGAIVNGAARVERGGDRADGEGRAGGSGRRECIESAARGEISRGAAAGRGAAAAAAATGRRREHGKVRFREEARRYVRVYVLVCVRAYVFV